MLINDYKLALENFIALSQKEFRTRIQVQQARARLQKAKEIMRGQEMELLELKID